MLHNDHFESRYLPQVYAVLLTTSILDGQQCRRSYTAKYSLGRVIHAHFSLINVFFSPTFFQVVFSFQSTPVVQLSTRRLWDELIATSCTSSVPVCPVCKGGHYLVDLVRYPGTPCTTQLSSDNYTIYQGPPLSSKY